MMELAKSQLWVFLLLLGGLSSGSISTQIGGNGTQIGENGNQIGGITTQVGRSAFITITVARDGSAKYKSIQAAVDSIPLNNTNRVIILIKSGLYREKVTIKSSFITFQGDGATRTMIEWNAIAKDEGPDGRALGTFYTPTLAVDGDNFIAKDLSIRNYAPPPPSGAQGMQGVALRVSGDMAAFYRMNIFGSQDTLYDHQGRHYFSRCYIEGSIDIVIGNGCSFFWRCQLHSIANVTGSLSAQKRSSPFERTGFSFVQCLVTGSGNVYLGRAWGPYSRIVYSYTKFPNIIAPEGWNDWEDQLRDNTVYFGEYRCTGIGANREERVKWSKELNQRQATNYISIKFIDGKKWLNEY